MRLRSKEMLIRVVMALIVDIDKERRLSEKSLRRYFWHLFIWTCCTKIEDLGQEDVSFSDAYLPLESIKMLLQGLLLDLVVLFS